MVFIKSKRAFNKYLKSEFSEYEFDRVEKPKKYPCYVYQVVSSWGYEESDLRYLYLEDLQAMLREIL